MKLIWRKTDSPLLSFRLVWRTGAAQDPKGKEGLAWMTARMLTGAGTEHTPYQEILERLFPMAASVGSFVDKEMVSVFASAHADTLDKFYATFREVLLEPGWREEDFTRLRDKSLNYLSVNLRGHNDEELGKEALALDIYRGHPYGWHNAGTIRSLEKLMRDDLREFWRTWFRQDNLWVAVAGNMPEAFVHQFESDLRVLPDSGGTGVAIPAPAPIERTRVTIVQKPAMGVAISFGHPIPVRRGDPDFLPLLVAQSALGQHRNSSGRLFTEMRQLRGLNYGDYAYLEYFPGGMYSFEPPPNVARSEAMFQIWIRPVDPSQAVFAYRLALHELDRLIQDGLTQEEFERTVSFLSKNVWVLLKTPSEEMGYAIDSEFYDIQDYATYLREGLQDVSLEDVNEAVRKHLRTDRLSVVMVAEDAAGLKEQLIRGAASPMSYNSAKPEELLAVDRSVEGRELGLRASDIRIVPVEEIFA